MQQGTGKALLACEEVLQRLRLEYVDLLLIHWPGVAKLEVSSALPFRPAHDSLEASAITPCSSDHAQSGHD